MKRVYWVAYATTGDQQLAEDLTQETFLVAWRKIPKFQLFGESLLPWLTEIARKQAANARRKHFRIHETEEISDEFHSGNISPDRSVESNLLLEMILKEVTELSEIDREIFQLCLVEEFNYQDAAQTLGVSQGTVRNRLSRIRARLRQLEV